VIGFADVERLALHAEALGQLAWRSPIRLGFWTLQRESDLLASALELARGSRGLLAARPPLLAGADGTGHGLAPAAAKDRRLGARTRCRRRSDRRGSRLAARARKASCRAAPTGGGWPAWAFQRTFRKLCEAAGLPHVQFRDLRRSGMVYAGELGVELQFITARSGHAVLGNKRTILDTYMPGNTRFTAEGMAMQWQRHLERIEQEKEQAQ
jgi:hypothetical protein